MPVEAHEMRLSVHIMVLNGAAVLERLLRPLRGVADEVCFVDTGSTDGTPDLLGRLGRDLGFDCRGVAISPLSRPDLYFPDASSSFAFLPDLPGPFSGRPLLRDWSAARNLGLDLCRGEYVMKLDADDEVLIPENILPALAHLDACPGVDFLCCPYEVMDGGQLDHVSLYTRIWRRRPATYFREILHENVDWGRTSGESPNWTIAAQGLTFRDHRDSPGQGVRVSLRNLKVLLREYQRLERENERPTAHLVMYLADEAAEVMPDFASKILHRWTEGLPLHEVDAGWRHMIDARSCETLAKRGALLEPMALAHYDEAARLGYPRAALRRALLLHDLGDLQGQGNWRRELRGAVDLNQGMLYPRGATLSEIARAERLLEEHP
jgi:glycosyltransferase involved in cell wall biosynthesis